MAVAIAAIVLAVFVERLGADTADSDERIVSRDMARSLLPHLGVAPFGGVTDLRDVVRPSDQIRAYFAAQGAVYRVFAADRQQATLVVWQRAATGPEPFNSNRTAVGYGCVILRHEQADIVRSVLSDCPDHVGPPPPAEPASWGRDSAAAAAVEHLVGVDASPNPVYLATHRPDGTTSASARTAAAVFAAVRATRLVVGTMTLEPAPDTGDCHARGRITVTVTAPDAIEPRLTVTAHGCSAFAVDLSDDVLPVVSEPVPCV